MLSGRPQIPDVLGADLGSMPTGPIPSGASRPRVTDSADSHLDYDHADHDPADPHADHDLGVVTTGSLAVVPPADGSPGPPSRLQTILQTVVVGLAALLVGLVVFTAVRTVAGNDDPVLADPDEGEADPDGPMLAPGPGDPGRREADTGDGQGGAALQADGTAADLTGQDPHDGQEPAAGSGDADPGATGPDDQGTPGSSPGPDRTGGSGLEGLTDATGAGGTAADGAGPANQAAAPSPSTGGGAATILPGARTTLVATTTPSGPANTPASETASTNSAPPSTSPTTSTTRPATTTTTRPPTSQNQLPNPRSLIASPANGAVLDWASPVTLRANPVLGAAEYCWRLAGLGGRSLDRCGSSPTTQLRGNQRNPGVGLITVDVEARDAGGATLRSQRTTFSLLALDVITSPVPGATLPVGRPLHLSSRALPGADRYCWTLVQQSASSGELCGRAPTMNLTRATVLASLMPGPLSIRLTIEGGGTVLGRQGITVDLLA